MVSGVDKKNLRLEGFFVNSEYSGMKIRMLLHSSFHPIVGLLIAAKTHLQWIMNVTIPHSHLFFFFCNAEVHFGNFHEYSDHNIIEPVKVIHMVTRYVQLYIFNIKNLSFKSFFANKTVFPWSQKPYFRGHQHRGLSTLTKYQWEATGLKDFLHHSDI